MKMKTVKVLALGCMLTSGVMAQEELNTSVLTSKKGVPILPQQGDYALGFDATPVLNFGLNAVNIMNDTGQDAEHPGYAGINQALFAKYFLQDNLAVRARLGVNTLNTTEKTFGDDPLYDGSGTPDNILLSTEKTGTSMYFLGAGLEWRRGYNRLQGYYGGEALIGFGTDRTNTSYEVSYNSDADDAGYISAGDTRTLVQNNGASLMLGLRGFVGVEYFVAPKISLGGEFGWGLGYSRQGRGKTEVESWDGSDAETVEGQGDSSSQVSLGVDQGAPALFGGNAFISLNFHF